MLFLRIQLEPLVRNLVSALRTVRIYHRLAIAILRRNFYSAEKEPYLERGFISTALFARKQASNQNIVIVQQPEMRSMGSSLLSVSLGWPLPTAYRTRRPVSPAAITSHHQQLMWGAVTLSAGASREDGADLRPNIFHALLVPESV